MTRRADDRLRATADADPYREGPRFDVWHDVLVAKRWASLAFPRDRSALHQFGEQINLLLKEVLVVREVIANERKRVDAGASSEETTGHRRMRACLLGLTLGHDPQARFLYP